MYETNNPSPSTHSEYVLNTIPQIYNKYSTTSSGFEYVLNEKNSLSIPTKSFKTQIMFFDSPLFPYIW